MGGFMTMMLVVGGVMLIARASARRRRKMRENMSEDFPADITYETLSEPEPLRNLGDLFGELEKRATRLEPETFTAPTDIPAYTEIITTYEDEPLARANVTTTRTKTKEKKEIEDKAPECPKTDASDELIEDFDLERAIIETEIITPKYQHNS
jgi:hypothetical protein